jgi:hypothetical protein
MCDPITLTAVASGLVLAGGALEAKGQMDAAKYQAQVARNQADLTEMNAQIAEQEKREETEQLLGQQRADFAARGINPNLATPSRIYESTARQGELDALTIRTNARNEVAGLHSQANASIALGRNQAYGTALSTAGQVAKMWAPAPT